MLEGLRGIIWHKNTIKAKGEFLIGHRIRWFGHVERRYVDYVVKRVDQSERKQTIRCRGRLEKNIRENIMT